MLNSRFPLKTGIIALLLVAVLSFFFITSNLSQENNEDQIANEEQNNPEEQEATNLPVVEVKTLEKGVSTEREFNKLGKVKAEERAIVVSEVAGRVGEIIVKTGEKVEKGTTLGFLGDSLNTNLLVLNYNSANRDKAIAEGILGATQNSTIRDIQVQENAVQTAYINLQTAIANQKNTLANLELQHQTSAISLKQAQASYSGALNTLNATKSSTGSQNFSNTRSLITQSQTALANAKMAIDIADLAFGEINPANSAIRGRLKERVDNTQLNHSIGDLHDAVEKLEIANKLLNTNYGNLSQNEAKRLASLSLDILDITESILLRADSFTKEAGTLSWEYTAEQTAQFNGQMPQAQSTLSGNRSALQQSLNTVSNGSESNKVQLIQLQEQAKQNLLQIESAKKAVEQAGIQYKTQADQLAYQIATAQAQYESAQAQLESTKAKLKISELQVQSSISQADKQAETANLQLEAATLKAPISGQISKIEVKTGEYTQQGQSLITIESTENLVIELDVTEQDLLKIRTGGTVTISNSKGETSEGEILEIAAAADSTSKQFPIKISIQDTSKFKSGTFVKVLFENNEISDDKFIVPLKAVFFTKTSKTVFVVNSEGLIEEKAIGISRIFGNSVEIADGLEEGDKVIIDGGRQLAPGMPVEIKS